MNLENEYEDIEPILAKMKILKDRLETLKNANRDLQFNIKRIDDMLPIITMYKERTKNNKNVINNLQKTIEEIIKDNPENIGKYKQSIILFNYY